MIEKLIFFTFTTLYICNGHYATRIKLQLTTILPHNRTYSKDEFYIFLSRLRGNFIEILIKRWNRPAGGRLRRVFTGNLNDQISNANDNLALHSLNIENSADIFCYSRRSKFVEISFCTAGINQPEVVYAEFSQEISTTKSSIPTSFWNQILLIFTNPSIFLAKIGHLRSSR